LAQKHNFMIFEDRKFIDIGHTVQQQYHGGALRISEFAHIVNASVLAGDGMIEALEQVITEPSFPYKGDRAILILAEMTTAGSLATGDYTRSCIEIAGSTKTLLSDSWLLSLWQTLQEQWEKEMWILSFSLLV